MLVHATPVGEDSLTVGAGELLAIMQRLAVGLQVALPSKALATLGAVVDLCDTRVLLFAMTIKRALALENLATVTTSEFAHSPMMLLIVCGNLPLRDDLVAQPADVELWPSSSSPNRDNVVGVGSHCAGHHSGGLGCRSASLFANNGLHFGGSTGPFTHLNLCHIHELVNDCPCASFR